MIFPRLLVQIMMIFVADSGRNALTTVRSWFWKQDLASQDVKCVMYTRSLIQREPTFGCKLQETMSSLHRGWTPKALTPIQKETIRPWKQDLASQDLECVMNTRSMIQKEPTLIWL